MYFFTLTIGDINMIHILENAHVMERIHILTSILAAIIAGLLNTNLYGGVFVYVGFHLLVMIMIALKLRNIESYFMKSIELLNGFGSGALVFLCVWIIVYNVVYTL